MTEPARNPIIVARDHRGRPVKSRRGPLVRTIQNQFGIYGANDCEGACRVGLVVPCPEDADPANLTASQWPTGMRTTISGVQLCGDCTTASGCDQFYDEGYEVGSPAIYCGSTEVTGLPNGVYDLSVIGPEPTTSTDTSVPGRCGKDCEFFPVAPSYALFDPDHTGLTFTMLESQPDSEFRFAKTASGPLGFPSGPEVDAQCYGKNFTTVKAWWREGLIKFDDRPLVLEVVGGDWYALGFDVYGNTPAGLQTTVLSVATSGPYVSSSEASAARWPSDFETWSDGFSYTAAEHMRFRGVLRVGDLPAAIFNNIVHGREILGRNPVDPRTTEANPTPDACTDPRRVVMRGVGISFAPSHEFGGVASGELTMHAGIDRSGYHPGEMTFGNVRWAMTRELFEGADGSGLTQPLTGALPRCSTTLSGSGAFNGFIGTADEGKCSNDPTLVDNGPDPAPYEFTGGSVTVAPMDLLGAALRGHGQQGPQGCYDCARNLTVVMRGATGICRNLLTYQRDLIFKLIANRRVYVPPNPPNDAIETDTFDTGNLLSTDCAWTDQLGAAKNGVEICCPGSPKYVTTPFARLWKTPSGWKLQVSAEYRIGVLNGPRPMTTFIAAGGVCPPRDGWSLIDDTMSDVGFDSPTVEVFDAALEDQDEPEPEPGGEF